jgi:DNA-binding LytR/AlgR family response regulator
VSNADQAIAILESDLKISLVFTNIDMPGTINGLKLAAAVRDRWPPVHLVVASGKHRPHKNEMPARTVFLPKPYLAQKSWRLSTRQRNAREVWPGGVVARFRPTKHARFQAGAEAHLMQFQSIFRLARCRTLRWARRYKFPQPKLRIGRP